MIDRTRLQVLIYSRHACCLCHDLERWLRGRQSLFDFDLSVIDIDDDPVLHDRYDTCVPVVVIDGEERFRGRVSTVLLERELLARASRR